MPEKIAIIMRGLPGSGKSWTARALARTLKALTGQAPVVVSADDYFVGEDGVYRYVPHEQGEAHKQCLRRFMEATASGEVVVVDNTNTSAHELSPYVGIAGVHDYTVHVVEMTTHPNACLRLQTHDVPEFVVGQMAARLRAPLPPYLCPGGVFEVDAERRVDVASLARDICEFHD